MLEAVAVVGVKASQWTSEVAVPGRASARHACTKVGGCGKGGGCSKGRGCDKGQGLKRV